MENNTYIPFLLSGSDKYIGSDRVDESTLRALMDSLGIKGTVRASFSFYNTCEEVDALVSGVKRVAKMFGM